MPNGNKKEQKELQDQSAEQPLAQETQEKIAERERKEEEIQEESVRKQTGTKLEMMEQMELYSPDTKTASTIDRVDIGMEDEEQIQESLELVGTVTVTILAKMFEGGIEKDSVDTLKEFKRVLKEIKSRSKHKELRAKLSNISEKSAFKKLQEILEHPESKIYQRLEREWGEYINKSKNIFDDASKGKLAETWKYVKKNPGKIVLAVAGAFALHGLYKAFIAEEQGGESNEGKPWTKRIFNKSSGMALGLMALGAILGSDDIIKFAKEHLTGEAKETVIRSAEKAKGAATNALNKRIHFDENKNRLQGVLPKEAAEALSAAGFQDILDDLGIDPEKTDHTAQFEGPGGALKMLKEWMQKKGYMNKKLEKVFDSLLKENEEQTPSSTETAPEVISEATEQRRLRYTAVHLGLTKLYCVQSKKLKKIEPKIINVFTQFPTAAPNTTLESIISAYKQGESEQKISLNTFNLEETDTSEEALFHACAIITKAFESSGEILKGGPDSQQTLEHFLENLGKDPSLEIASGVQESIAEKLKELKITSVVDLKDNAEKLFNVETINEVFERNQEKFIEHLVLKYNLETTTSLNKKEKTEFIAIIALLYKSEKAYALNQSVSSIEQFASNNTTNPKVVEAVKSFVEAIKEDVLQKGGLLDQCVDRYDIKTKSEKYNHVLQRYLKPEMLDFKDGFQMALLADGIQFEKPSELESIGQAKDITMIYLILRILKEHSPNEAYPLYAANITKIATSEVDLQLNVNFKAIAPYFEKLFDVMLEKTKDYFNNMLTFAEGWEDLSEDPDKIEKIAQMDSIEFLLSSAKYGGKGAIRIPKDLVLTLAGEFPEGFHPETGGEDIMQMILTLGGTITFPQGIALGVGLIYLGGKYYFCKPIDIGIDTLSALVSEGPGTAAKTYLFGTSPFIVFGTTYGTLTAGAAHGSALKYLKGAGRGALRGLAAPANMPIQGIRAVRGTYRYGKYYSQAIRGKNIANLEMSSALFARYNDLTRDMTSGVLHQFEAWRKQPATEVRKLMYQDLYQRARIRWGEKFMTSYNNFWDLNPEMLKTGEARNQLYHSAKDAAFFETQEFRNKLDRMQEVMKEMKKIKNLEGISEEELMKEVKKFLEPPEIDALEKRIAKDGFEKFRKNLSSDLEATKANGSRIARIRDAAKTRLSNARIKERFKQWHEARKKTPETPEATKKQVETPEKGVLSKTAETLKNAEKNLSTIQKRIADAEKEIKALSDLRDSKGYTGWDASMQKRLDDAREIINQGRAAEIELKQSIQAFEKVRELEGQLSKAITHAPQDVAKLRQELKTATQLAEESLETSSLLTKNLGKAGAWGRITKYGRLVGKYGGTGLAGLGAVVSYVQAGSAGYEALTTDVEGRSTVKGIEAGIWTVNAVADTAAVAVLLGAKGGAVAGAGSLALPLIPLTYVGVNAVEAAYEETMTDYEWAQKRPYEALHHFYTSLDTISVGDIYLTAARGFDAEKGLEEHHNTMRKIYRGLVAMQKDPSLLNYIIQEPESDEKNKEVERRIQENYSVYHEMYFQSLNPYGVQSYRKAEQIVLEAQMFDRIMSTRDKAKEQGQQLMIGNKDDFQLNLCDEDFEIVGGMDEPKFYNSAFLPETIVKMFKEDLTREFQKDEIYWNNLERMDSAYLLRLCAQIQLAINDPEQKAELEKEEGLTDFLTLQFVTLKNYLEANRGVNFEYGIRNGDLFEPRMSTQELLKNMKEMGSGDMKQYLDFEKQNYSQSPASHALSKLAEYFGFNGQPTEIKLKEFFTEESASYHGIYWDGENWFLQERGHEFDDNLGPTLNEAMIRQVIEYMRENPDDVLEHRNDAIFLDAYDYEKEVMTLAKILEDGLAEGKQRGYVEAKEAASSTPPQQFKEKEVEYESQEKSLPDQYKESIEHVKEECNWTRLKYSIIDDDTIELSRTDANTSVKLNRSGSKWSVEGYKTGLTLAQAVVLGNLKNKVEDIILSNDHTGGSKTPFEVDNGSIDFDRNWNPNDLRILDKETGWLGFYDEVGITPEDVAETLNNWYKNRS